MAGIPQPIRPNNTLQHEHAAYCAGTGGGKTQAINKLGLLKATDQIVFLDPYGDYEGEFKGRKVRTYTKLSEFYSAVRQARKGTRGFKIAYKPPGGASPEALEMFSRVVWSCGDGHHVKPLKAVFEELAKMTKSPGKAVGHFGEILTGGRKFGLHAHCCFQRGQEVPKTVMGNLAWRWIGLQPSKKDAVYLENEMDIPAELTLSFPVPATAKRIQYAVRGPMHKAGEYTTGVWSLPKRRG